MAEVIEYIQQHEGAIGLLHAELALSDLRLKIHDILNSPLARIWGPFLMAVGLIRGGVYVPILQDRALTPSSGRRCSHRGNRFAGGGHRIRQE